MKKLLVASAMLGLVSFAAHAEDAKAEESTTSTTKVSSDKSKKTDEADQVITNRRFRAQEGALSNWSFNSSFSYSGGSIDDPIGSGRPNITGANDVLLIQNLSANLGVSYRLSKRQRLRFGIGLQVASPFSSDADPNLSARARSEFDSTQGEVDLNNPSIRYSYIFKMLGVQSIASVGTTFFTQDGLTNNGFETFTSATLNTMYDFGDSGASFGLLISAGFYTHDKDFNDAGESLLDNQNELDFYIMPQAEYVINDTFNLRTIVRAWRYQNTRGQSFSDWTKQPVTQSVGLGISLFRDLFLYPNVQFVPDNIRADRTNVGITVNLNL